jgi:hypothetical protein
MAVVELDVNDAARIGRVAAQLIGIRQRIPC